MNYIEEVTKTLRRIPQDVFLAIATREFDMEDAESCLCGNAIKEMIFTGMIEYDQLGELAATEGRVYDFDIPRKCSVLFGGTYSEWKDIFDGVVKTVRHEMSYDYFCYGNTLAYFGPVISEIEEAFTNLLNEYIV